MSAAIKEGKAVKITMPRITHIATIAKTTTSLELKKNNDMNTSVSNTKVIKVNGRKYLLKLSSSLKIRGSCSLNHLE